MTLDQAKDRFEEAKTDRFRQAEYIKTATEYYLDEMIEPSTYARVLDEVSAVAHFR